MARGDNFRKWHQGMDAILIETYDAGECSVSDLAKKLGVTEQTVYPHMRRLGLPLLGQPGCKLRSYKTYGTRYNEVVFSSNQIDLVRRLNAEGWDDCKIAQELGVSAGPLRKLRCRLGLPVRKYKPLPIDERFGNVVVLGPASPERKRGQDSPKGVSSRSLVRCDCGAEITVFNEDLRSEAVKNCGNRTCPYYPIYVGNPDSEWIRIFHAYRSGAIARGVEFPLSLEQVKYICRLACFYCEGQATNKAVPPKRSHPSRIILEYNGIDQVTARGGYHPGNVLPCCSFCNRAKDSSTLESFIPWINRIHRVRGKPIAASSVKAAAAKLGKCLEEIRFDSSGKSFPIQPEAPLGAWWDDAANRK